MVKASGFSSVCNTATNFDSTILKVFFGLEDGRFRDYQKIMVGFQIDFVNLHL